MQREPGMNEQPPLDGKSAAEPPPDLLTPKGRERALQMLAVLFKPNSPINTAHLFAGRQEQRARFLQVLETPGQHMVIYGERGVGKTSFAKVMAREIADVGATATVRCSSDDSFVSVWTDALQDIGVSAQGGTGFASRSDDARTSAVKLIGAGRPREIAAALEHVCEHNSAVVFFFDEFERLKGKVRRSFADTIKILSDGEVRVTVVAIGVGETVDELIKEHGSVERATDQIRMPRMSTRELADILRTGFEPIGMRADQFARAKIIRLSQGLPHYTHLLALGAGRVAVAASASTVTMEHVDRALNLALEGGHRTHAEAYQTATACSSDEDHYADILLAAALARGDKLGYFQPADVTGPLKTILERSSGVLPDISRYLEEMTKPDRGRALQRRAESNHYRYRFRRPMFQPYVIMRGFEDKRLTQTLFDKVHGSPY